MLLSKVGKRRMVAVGGGKDGRNGDEKEQKAGQNKGLSSRKRPWQCQGG